MFQEPGILQFQVYIWSHELDSFEFLELPGIQIFFKAKLYLGFTYVYVQWLITFNIGYSVHSVLGGI